MRNEKIEKLKRKIRCDYYFNRVITILLGIYTIVNIFACIASFRGETTTYLTSNEQLGNLVRTILVFIIFLFLDILLTDIRKNRKPFAIKTVNCLRAMAVCTMLISILPKAVMSIGGFFDSTASFILTFRLIQDGVFLMIGAAIGIISEIFRYGIELEDDLDSII